MTNKMKASNTLSVCAIILLLLPHFACTQSFRRDGEYYTTTIEKTFDVQPDGRLDMDRISGSIEVNTWSRNRVEIIQEIRAEVSSESAFEDLVEREERMYHQSGNTVEVEGVSQDQDSLWDRLLDRDENFDIQRKFVIRVPEHFNIDLNTSGGEITVTSLTGDVDLFTSGGRILLEAIEGSVDASTSGGNLIFSEIGGSVEASTSGGNVKIQHVVGEVDISTSGGNVEIVDVTDDVDAATSGGNMELENIGGDVDAATSGGNIRAIEILGDVVVATSGGNVTLRSIRGSVQATTSGGRIVGEDLESELELNTSAGDIAIQNARGPVVAHTSVGDIEVELTLTDFQKPHNMHLVTSNGDITVRLPADLPAQIEAEIQLRGRFDRNDIHSDFPLVRDTSDEGETIKAKGMINGGGSLIRLEVNGGSIFIEKTNP